MVGSSDLIKGGLKGCEPFIFREHLKSVNIDIKHTKISSSFALNGLVKVLAKSDEMYKLTNYYLNKRLQKRINYIELKCNPVHTIKS